MFENKTLLITGGTGSFGNAVLDHFRNKGLREIRILSRDEKKQDDLRAKYKDDKINYIIGDVRNSASVDYAMYGVDYVFQAAALKQVPTCEFYPMEAIQTNILGSENVLESAVKHGVKKIVVLSTDKAVYPINTMGMSKALMEKLAISKSRDPRLKKGGGIITATRYGNVMASRGSIIPLFAKQIKSGEKLTITNPDMTRFMMSLEDSVKLVLFAFKNANQGDIFVQKSEATTILNLAEVMLDIFNANNGIKIIGSRHGEKMHETLCSSEEMAKAKDHGNFYSIPADLRDLNYTRYFNTDKNVRLVQEYDSSNTHRLTHDELKNMLLKLPYIKQELNV